MWIVFRDPKNVFLHLDKFVYELVEPENIVNYQRHLSEKFPGGRVHEFIETANHLQPFFTASDGQCFFVRNFPVWRSTNSLQTEIAILAG